MILTVPRLLFWLALSLVAVDLAWACLVHFDIDRAAYLRLGLLPLGLFAGGLFYQTIRPDPAPAAMLMGASFLLTFSTAASVLNYFLLTVAGTRIDGVLAAADRALGFDWGAVMMVMAHHPFINGIFFRAYNLILPEIALVLIALAWSGRAEKAYRFCLAVAVGALIAMAIWTLTPSFGAVSIYVVSPAVLHQLTLAVSADYGRALVQLLHNGPGHISPADLRGLIAFPSYHGVLALILIWYAWRLSWLRWPVLVTNSVVLICTPIQGGHHMVDVLAAFPVTALTLFLSESGKLKVLVNARQILTLAVVPTGGFRAATAQKVANGGDAIKPVLNSLP
jgi:hypothetical protein